MATTRTEERNERVLRELLSDLVDLVESGDLTDAQANEILIEKQDRMNGGR